MSLKNVTADKSCMLLGYFGACRLLVALCCRDYHVAVSVTVRAMLARWLRRADTGLEFKEGPSVTGKSLIVYYSCVGNTKVVAEEIRQQAGYDIRRIEETLPRQLKGIMWAALGAGKTTPAINSFLSRANFRGKKVWLFFTLASEQAPPKFIDSVTRRVEAKGGKVLGSLACISRWDPKANVPLKPEEAREKVRQWLAHMGGVVR